jgi:hypothetical protein
MKNAERGLWTIEELSVRVAEALAVGYDGVPSNRVRDVPDLRTIRYYTALGLLDRPAAMQGRTALYGPRHLLQLVAIKRLQAQGLSLAAVQERVLGISNAALRRIVQPSGPKHRIEAPTGAAPDLQPSASRGNSFWRLPATVTPDHAQSAAIAGAPPPADRDGSEPRVANLDFQTIPLGEGLSLSLFCHRRVGEDDLRSIRAAAASLVEVLKLRGLIDRDVDTEAKKPGDAR